jgi:hypothetical protein
MYIIDKLPTDIIREIIPYTYQCQPTILLEDIQDFYITKTKIVHIYKVIFNSTIEYYIDEYKDWLINDLIAFANDYQATLHGYTSNFYEIFTRYKLIYSMKNVEAYFAKIQSRNVQSQSNVLWGIFTPNERRLFIQQLSE